MLPMIRTRSHLGPKHTDAELSSEHVSVELQLRLANFKWSQLRLRLCGKYLLYNGTETVKHLLVWHLRRGCTPPTQDEPCFPPVPLTDPEKNN